MLKIKAKQWPALIWLAGWQRSSRVKAKIASVRPTAAAAAAAESAMSKSVCVCVCVSTCWLALAVHCHPLRATCAQCTMTHTDRSSSSSGSIVQYCALCAVSLFYSLVKWCCCCCRWCCCHCNAVEPINKVKYYYWPTEFIAWICGQHCSLPDQHTGAGKRNWEMGLWFRLTD